MSRYFVKHKRKITSSSSSYTYASVLFSICRGHDGSYRVLKPIANANAESAFYQTLIDVRDDNEPSLFF